MDQWVEQLARALSAQNVLKLDGPAPNNISRYALININYSFAVFLTLNQGKYLLFYLQLPTHSSQ